VCTKGRRGIYDPSVENLGIKLILKCQKLLLEKKRSNLPLKWNHKKIRQGGLDLHLDVEMIDGINGGWG